MKVRALRTHIDAAQNTRRRGDVYDINDRDAEKKIRRGVIEAVDAAGEGRSFFGRKSPEKAAHQTPPDTKAGKGGRGGGANPAKQPQRETNQGGQGEGQ